MHSIKTKITAMTVCVIVIAMVIATVFGVTAIRDVGNRDAEQMMRNKHCFCYVKQVRKT